MNRESTIGVAAGEPLNRQHRCICCDGMIDIAPDQDAALGLSLRLGLVSDEYALICDGCAARLASERRAIAFGSKLV